ncbi:MAG TPA: hypothetical protein PLA12_12585 [Candidatus Hydrogenedens sp.]|nr:hypothetical protein [Candidatus Hydrogenedens sp.]
MSLFTKNFARKSQKCFSYLKKDIALILQSIFTPKLGIVYSPSGGSGFGEEKKKSDIRGDKKHIHSPIPDKEQEKNKSTSTLSLLSEQLNNYLLDLMELKSELLQEQKQNEQLLQVIQDLREEKKGFEQQKSLLNEEIQLLKKQLQETALSLKALEQQLHSTQIDQQADKTKLRELQEALHQKQQENIEIATRYAESEEIILNLTKKIQNTTVDLSNALVHIAELESIEQQLEDKLSKQKLLLKDKEDEIKKYQFESNQFKTQIAQLQTNIATLKTYIDTQQQLLDKLVKEKEIILKENQKLSTEMAKAISEKKKQEEQQQKLEQKHREIIEQCQGLLRTIEGLKKESERFQQEYRASVQRNEELSESVKYWQYQVETLKEQLALIGDEQNFEEKSKYEDTYTRLVMALQAKEKPYLKLGELLIKAGFITNTQLEEVLTLQKDKQYCRLGTLLLEQEWIDEIVLFQALSLQKNIPLLFINEKHVNIEQAYLLEYPFCMKYLLLPLRTCNTTQILLSTTEPDNTDLLKEVEKVFTLPVKGVYSCPTNIIEVIEKIFDRI